MSSRQIYMFIYLQTDINYIFYSNFRFKCDIDTYEHICALLNSIGFQIHQKYVKCERLSVFLFPFILLTNKRIHTSCILKHLCIVKYNISIAIPFEPIRFDVILQWWQIQFSCQFPSQLYHLRIYNIIHV